MSNNVYKDPYKERTIEELTLQRAAQRKSRKDKKTYGLKNGDLVEITGGGGKPVEVDDRLSGTSENPVQNKVITGALGGKQNELISGSTIKTVNGNSLLGSGNIEITAGGGTISVDSEISDTSENPVQNKAIKKALDKKQETLISEYNIKSINGQTLLEGGILTIKEGHDVDAALSKDSTNPVQNKVISEQLIPVSEAVGDKAYNPSDFSGMARVNLPKNGGVLTQDMMPLQTGKNTIYVIQYDYTLNNQTITVPENSVLKFEGGSLKQGALRGEKNTQILSLNRIIFKEVKFEGVWNITFNATWFVDDSLEDCYPQLQFMFNCGIKFVEFPLGRVYKISRTLTINNSLKIIEPQNSNKYSWSTISIKGNNTVLHYTHSSNWNDAVWLKGVSILSGEKLSKDNLSTSVNYNIPIVLIDNTEGSGCWGVNVKLNIQSRWTMIVFSEKSEYRQNNLLGLEIKSGQNEAYFTDIDIDGYIQTYIGVKISGDSWITDTEIKADTSCHIGGVFNDKGSPIKISGMHQPGKFPIKGRPYDCYFYAPNLTVYTTTNIWDTNIGDSNARTVKDNILADKYFGGISNVITPNNISNLNNDGLIAFINNNNYYKLLNDVSDLSYSINTSKTDESIKFDVLEKCHNSQYLISIEDGNDKRFATSSYFSHVKYPFLLEEDTNSLISNENLYFNIKLKIKNSILDDGIVTNYILDIPDCRHCNICTTIEYYYSDNTKYDEKTYEILNYDSIYNDHYLLNMNRIYIKEKPGSYRIVKIKIECNKKDYNFCTFENTKYLIPFRFQLHNLIKRNNFSTIECNDVFTNKLEFEDRSDSESPYGKNSYLPILLGNFSKPHYSSIFFVTGSKYAIVDINLFIGNIAHSVQVKIANNKAYTNFPGGINVYVKNYNIKNTYIIGIQFTAGASFVRATRIYASGSIYNQEKVSISNVSSSDLIDIVRLGNYSRGDIDASLLTSDNKGYGYFNISENKKVYWTGTKMVDSNGNEYNALKEGTTSQRPTDKVNDNFYYFDTTLGRPIWRRRASPSGWIKSDGTDADAPAPTV